MKARTLLIFIIILLVLANGFIFFQAQQKRNQLDRAHQLLVNDSTMARHLRYVWRIQKSALASYVSPEDTIAYAAFLAGIELMEVVDQLEKFSKRTKYSSSVEFFSKPISVDAALRDSLYTSYEKLDAAMRKLYPDTLSEHFYHASKKARVNYQSILSKIGPGLQRFDFPLEIPWELPVEKINVTALRVNGVTEWNDAGEKIPAFIRNLDFFTYHSKLGIYENLNTLKQTLGVRNKVRVFDKTYDLADLSPAQLRAIVNHLKFVQSAMNAHIIQPISFYQDEK